jgi:hypothetical protein
LTYSSFDALSNRIATAAVEKYGSRQDLSTDLDKREIYRGPNIRAFMSRNNLDPGKWRELLDYNRFGSAMDLVEGETQLSIPTTLQR